MSEQAEDPFYSALERFERLRGRFHPRVAWSADGRSVRWSIGEGDSRLLYELALGDGIQREVEPEIGKVDVPDGRGEARTYLREVYLMPGVPAREARSPDGVWFASVRDGDVWLRHALSDQERRLTDGATATLTWDIDGQGVDMWSPDGRNLLAFQFDRALVPRVPRPRFCGDTVSVDWPRQQRAGAPLDVVQPYLLQVDGGVLRRIELGDMRDHYVRALGWLPDASEVLLARYTRTLNRIEIVAVNAETVTSRMVMSEASRTFLASCDVIWFASTGFTLLPGGQFLWLSEREGWKHLYLGSLTGGQQRCLTQGPCVVREVIRTDESHVYFRATEDTLRPYDIHLYRVPLAGGLQERLTAGEGEHEVVFSPDGAYFVDIVSAPATPSRSVLRHADGSMVTTLAGADRSTFETAGSVAPEEFVVRAADGVTPLHGVLYKPPGFDPARRYPLVHWIYGGPQHLDVSHSFGPRPGKPDAFLWALADSGYLVLTLDARGTPGRSKEFQDAVYHEWRNHVVSDHSSALRQLISSRPYVDVERIGVVGRSWGGYFALCLLAQSRDLYRAAVCVVPGFDPYGGNIYEPYLGLPQVDDSPYRAAEPWSLVAQITGRVLMIGGTLDTSTLWDMYRMARVLTEADVRHQLLIFPEQEHSFDRNVERFNSRSIRDFFDEALRA